MNRSVADTMPRPRRIALAAVALVAALIAIIGVAAELIARSMEGRSEGWVAMDPHPRLGWVPRPGVYRTVTPEFQTTSTINALGMSDNPVGERDRRLPYRIIAVGDSHTMAVGASTDDTWPNQLEKLLFGPSKPGTVYNAGVMGYSVGQYLERYESLAEVLRPTLVIVGFSMATDLYDLIPPERGGFIYGGDASRIYYEFDRGGRLVRKQHVATAAQPAAKRAPQAAPAARTRPSASAQLRGFLEQFALYRRLKRSKLAMWVAANIQVRGESLWPGLDTALKRSLSPDDAYRWQLAEAVLGELVRTARGRGADVIVVNIPYLAQVYDDVWESAFGSAAEKYNRAIGSERLQALCQRIGAHYIDTTPALMRQTKALGRWLHWHNDAHPTAEGHRVIAEAIAEKLSVEALLSSRAVGAQRSSQAQKLR